MRPLIEYIRKQQFHPSLLGLFVNPFYFARKGLVNAVKQLGPKISGKTLDVGCGNKPYKRYMSSSEYIGLELDTQDNRSKKEADCYYDGNLFPFPDASFDSIICNQVLEHVFNPEYFLSEINRVLNNGGNVLITVPFIWDEHEQPYDYARYSSFGLRYILENNGFEIIECVKTQDNISVIFQMINAYLFKVLCGNNLYIKLLMVVIFMSPFNIIGLILSKVLPRNPDLYLDNVVLARKSSTNEKL